MHAARLNYNLGGTIDLVLSNLRKQTICMS